VEKINKGVEAEMQRHQGEEGEEEEEGIGREGKIKDRLDKEL
jgi:hypothetical protein